MYDYLICTPDEATAHAVLDPLGFGNPGPSGWDDDRVLRVALTVVANELPVQDPRFWIVVSLPQPSDALYAVPYCMREADRDLALAGQPYVVRERFTAEQLATPWSISPQWAGVDYSNGAVPAVSGPTGAQGATGAIGATGASA